MERVDFMRIVIPYIEKREDFMELVIPYLEKALGFNLWENQIHYLVHGIFTDHGRRTGKTTAYCIKLALSQGEPLDMRRPEGFADGWHNPSYPRHFKMVFLEIRSKLKEYGFPVRDIKF